MSIKRYAITAIVILVLGVEVDARKKAGKEPEAPPVILTPPPTTQSYSSTDHGFALDAPVELMKKENEGDALVVFISPAAGPNDKFQKTFSVSVDDKSKPKTVDQYVTQTLTAAKKEKKGFKSGTPDTASVGGVNGKVVTLEYRKVTVT
ncbi:MAG: hypothetical protein V2G42_06860 [bacterium JZ-2024 1]